MSTRGRLVASLLLAVATVAGLVALELRLGARPPGGGPVAPVSSGAWFCPHGGGKGVTAWVVLANHSDRAAEVRVATLRAREGPTEVAVEVPPGTLRYVEVPAEHAPAASVLDFFGAPVAAGMVAVGPEGQGLGAEPCAPEASRQWFLPEGTTTRGQSTRLVVMNPFATEAALDVQLAAPERVLRPGELRGLVLPPRRSISFDLGRFALGEEALVASVRATLGRVVVGGVGRSSTGLRVTLGSPVAALRWVLPGIGGDGGTDLQVAALGAREAPFRVRVQRPDGQVPAIDGASLDGPSARTFEVPAEDAGMVVEAAGTAPLVAARRSRSVSARDAATTAGTAARATWWAALPAAGPGGGMDRLVLQNPGEDAAVATVRLLSDLGPVDAPELGNLMVGPGRILVVDLSEATGGRPVAALVQVRQGTLVPAQASVSETGYAIAVAVPMEGTTELDVGAVS